MFKKMVIADRMALLVDPVFANPAGYETAVVWMAAVAYSIQIYCDFSGYSDIALGTARLLGYRLAINFAMPFAATEHHRTLAALAHLAVELDSRLHLHSARREPRLDVRVPVSTCSSR